jgi:hypothetical protein
VGECALAWRCGGFRAYAFSPFRPSATRYQPFTYITLNHSPPSTRAGHWNTTRVGEQASSLRDGVAGRYRGERELGPNSMTAVPFVLPPRAGLVPRCTRFKTLLENPA